MNKNTKLYRYDLVSPPSEWDRDYKSIQYHDSQWGSKNQIGAFFFYDNCCDCFQTALNAAKEHDCYNIYISTCELESDVNLLHLQDRNIYRLLCMLYDIGIDILTEDFKIFYKNGSVQTFNNVWELYFQIRNLENNNKNYTNQVKQLISFWGDSRDAGGNYGYFGQLLTDFENGIMFKKILQEKGYDGYCFYEGCTDSTPQVTTYCLFSSNYLSEPMHRKIDLIGIK